MKSLLLKFWEDEEGATAIEYALIAGLVAVAIIVAFSTFGEGIGDLFENIGTKMSELGKEVTDTPITPTSGE